MNKFDTVGLMMALLALAIIARIVWMEFRFTKSDDYKNLLKSLREQQLSWINDLHIPEENRNRLKKLRTVRKTKK